jgi:DNA-binding PadR family transcriptional regulator
MKTTYKKSPKAKEPPFAKVPLWFAAEVAKATKSPGTMVWMWLLYLAWKSSQHTRRLSAELANKKLKEWGVSSKVKLRVIRDLERAGLITVERQPKKSPIVTMVVL